MNTPATAAILKPVLGEFTLPEAESGGWRRLPNRAHFSPNLLRLKETGRIPEGPSRNQGCELLEAQRLRPPTAAELYHFVLDTEKRYIFEDRPYYKPCGFDQCGTLRAVDEFTATDIVKPKRPSRKKSKHKDVYLDLWVVEENGQQLGEVWIPDTYTSRVKMHPVFGVPDGLDYSESAERGFYLYNSPSIRGERTKALLPIDRLTVSFEGFSDNAKLPNRFIVALIEPNAQYNGNAIRPMKGPYPKFEKQLTA